MADTIINGTDLLLYKRTVDAITTNTLNDGGTGYAVNDIFYVNEPAYTDTSQLAIGRVLTLSATAVATYELLYTGRDYTVGTGASAKTTSNKVGTGSGLKINVAAVSGTVYQATGHSTSHTLSIKHSTRLINSKASGNYTTREAGRLDVSGSADGLCSYVDTVGLREFTRLIDAKEQVFLIFAENGDVTAPIDEVTPNTSKFYASGYFLLTSVELNAADQSNTTYSISFELSNSFTLTNIS